MLGQLHDAGNTVTLAHYLELLSCAFLVSKHPEVKERFFESSPEAWL